MKADALVKRWEKTSRQNLVRHISGRYYARLFLNGKEIWKSLKTDSFSVAQAKLAELRKGHKEAQAQVVEPSAAKLTFGQAAKLHLDRIDHSSYHQGFCEPPLFSCAPSFEVWISHPRSARLGKGVYRLPFEE